MARTLYPALLVGVLQTEPYFTWILLAQLGYRTGNRLEKNFERWMQFINEYKNRGGKVTLGSDAGYIYKLYGFGYIQEMELFREAGFHPLEIFMSASLRAAEVLGIVDQVGTIEVGKKADMVIVDANPLANL